MRCLRGQEVRHTQEVQKIQETEQISKKHLIKLEAKTKSWKEICYTETVFFFSLGEIFNSENDWEESKNFHFEVWWTHQWSSEQSFVYFLNSKNYDVIETCFCKKQFSFDQELTWNLLSVLLLVFFEISLFKWLSLLCEWLIELIGTFHVYLFITFQEEEFL